MQIVPMRVLKDTVKIEKLCSETKGPVFVTKNGYGKLVVMDIVWFEDLLNKVYEAKAIGADAVLLIMSVLGKEKAKEYLEIAHSIGIGALVEAHDEKEVLDAVEIGAKVVGVNNRNLKDFTIDMQNSIRLRNLAPASVKFVSESGIKERSDIEVLEKNNVDAVLIGETLMRQGIENIVNQINILRNGKD